MQQLALIWKRSDRMLHQQTVCIGQRHFICLFLNDKVRRSMATAFCVRSQKLFKLSNSLVWCMSSVYGILNRLEQGPKGQDWSFHRVDKLKDCKFMSLRVSEMDRQFSWSAAANGRIVAAELQFDQKLRDFARVTDNMISMDEDRLLFDRKWSNVWD